MDLIESVHGRYVHERRTSVLSGWCSRLIPFDSQVLDVGCGDGRLARLIADKRPDISICGMMSGNAKIQRCPWKRSTANPYHMGMAASTL
jgi:2-polyprenyl-3-methyl-5-hydroxy-6-metoxy-1,4-benzoquinol methylase